MRVKLKNVKTHINAEFNFEKGVNLIMGPNGSGKSTILQSIFLALLGDGFASRFPEKISGFIRRGESTMSIEVEIEHNNERYTIRRSWRKIKFLNTERVKAEEAYIAKGNFKLASEQRKVTEWVEKLFGINKKNIDLIYYSQEEITKFISYTPKERKELIDDILEIKELEEFSEMLKKVSRQISKVKIELLKKDLDRIDSELRRTDELKEEKAKLEEEIARLEEERNALNEKLISLKKYYDEYLELKGKLDSISRELSSYSYEKVIEEINKLNKTVNQKIELSEEEKQILENESEVILYNQLISKIKGINIDEINSKINQLKPMLGKLRRVRDIVRQIELLDSEIKNIEEQLSQLKRKKELVEEELRKTKEEISKLSSLQDIDQLILNKEKLIAEKEAIAKLLDNLKDTCPVCGSPLTPEKIAKLKSKKQTILNDINNLKKEIEKLKELQLERKKLDLLFGKKDTLESQIAQLDQEIEKLMTLLNQKLTKKQSLENELKALGFDRREISNIEKEYEQLLNEISYLARKRDEYYEILEKLEKIRYKIPYEELLRIKEKEKKIKEIELAREKLEKYISIKEKFELLKEIKDKLLSLEEKKLEYEELSRKLEEVIAQLSELRGRLKKIEDEILRIEKMKEKRSQIENKIKKYEKLKERLERLSIVLSRDGVPKILREKFVTYLNEAVNNYLQIFTDKFFIKITPDLDIRAIPSYNPSDNGISANSLSGGEKVMVSLSIALAMLNWLNLNSFIVLDEPTANLDEERSMLLPKIFERLENLVEQALIVTHNQNLDNGQFYVIRL